MPTSIPDRLNAPQSAAVALPSMVYDDDRNMFRSPLCLVYVGDGEYHIARLVQWRDWDYPYIALVNPDEPAEWRETVESASVEPIWWVELPVEAQ